MAFREDMSKTEKACWCIGFVCLLTYFVSGVTSLTEAVSYAKVFGFALAVYLAGSFVHSIYTGNREIGTSTTEFHCGNCRYKLNFLSEVAGEEGAIKCPQCGVLNR